MVVNIQGVSTLFCEPDQEYPMSSQDSKKTDTVRRNMLGGMITAGAALAVSSAVANTMSPAPLSGRANQNGRFAGRSILITGATSGIGKTTAEAFAREGARVMFCGRREMLGREVEAGIQAFGGQAAYRKADVREAPQVAALVEACVAAYGRIDVLFNNAGIFMTPGEIQDIEIANFQDIMVTNAGGTFYGMKYTLPHMRSQGSGVIVNMSSVAGHKGFAITAAYNASKHAIIGMMKAAAIANAKHNIRINSISPLAVDTPQLRESFEYQQITYEAAAPNFVTPRIMTTDEIARAVMFLASDEATSINGMDLDVTGGQIA
jgi:NAD(P)-dependent dehydrogenase (short-subunit alcohol dehydrogenase family)